MCPTMFYICDNCGVCVRVCINLAYTCALVYIECYLYRIYRIQFSKNFFFHHANRSDGVAMDD